MEQVMKLFPPALPTTSDFTDTLDSLIKLSESSDAFFLLPPVRYPFKHKSLGRSSLSSLPNHLKFNSSARVK